MKKQEQEQGKLPQYAGRVPWILMRQASKVFTPWLTKHFKTDDKNDTDRLDES